MISYREFSYDAHTDEIIHIYADNGWSAYLKDDAKLKRAFDRSIFRLGAFDGEKLVGFIRCVGDGEHIILIQDLIIAHSFQRKGIGSELIALTFEKYRDVRMICLMTDSGDEAANAFYRKIGMKPVREGNMITYFKAD